MERRHFLGLAGLLPLTTPLFANTATSGRAILSGVTDSTAH